MLLSMTKRVMLGSTALAGVILCTPAAAQAPAPATGPAVEQLNEVVVTASRIQRSGFTAPTPTTVLGADVIQARGSNNAIDVINEVPAFRPTQTPAAAARGGSSSGGSFVDLRGLNTSTGGNSTATARTLVLVDGRRVVPSNAVGQVDISLIPTSLIARTDVVTGGASATYGSDAVAGVVNLILKDRLQGIQGNIGYGTSSRGDNKEYSASLAAGTSFAGGRGHVIVGGEYVDNKGVPDAYVSRAWGRKGWGTVVNTGARPAGIPSRVLTDNVRISDQMTVGGIVNGGPLDNLAFGPGGVPFTFQPGGYVGGNQMVGGGNNGIFFTGGSNLVNPVKHYSGLARVNYDLNDNIEGFLELASAHSDFHGFSASKRDAPPIGLFVIRNDNAFLPASVKAQMAALNLTTINVGRIAYDNNFNFTALESHQTTNRLATGLKGKVFGNWKWDVTYTAGENHFKQSNQAVIVSNYYAAVDSVIGANGQATCRVNVTGLTNQVNFGVNYGLPDPGCQPFNIFGQNSPSQAAVDYVRTHYTQDMKIREQTASANLQGEPFSLPAGPVSLALGAEWRKESAFSTVDPNSLLNRLDLGNFKPIDGSYNTKELYGETLVPLLKDSPLGKSLDVTGAVRRTDYSTSGVVTTWKVGGSYSPITDLRFRATESRDIRAPALNELFASTFTRSTVNGAQVDTYTVANPTLNPERAKTFTAGAVYQPSWMRGLKGSVDYYNIQIKDVIGTLAAQLIVDRCTAGVTVLCGDILRTPTGSISRINTRNTNLNLLKTNGFDFELSDTFSLSRFHAPGNLNVRWLATLVSELATTDPGGRVNRAGQLAPKWSWNLSATYNVGRLSANAQYRYIGKTIIDATLIGPDRKEYSPTLANSISDNTRPPVGYLNLSAQYTLLEKGGKTLQIYGVANNVFDTEPPKGAGDNPVGASLYELVGRAFKMGFRFTY